MCLEFEEVLWCNHMIQAVQWIQPLHSTVNSLLMDAPNSGLTRYSGLHARIAWFPYISIQKNSRLTYPVFVQTLLKTVANHTVSFCKWHPSEISCFDISASTVVAMALGVPMQSRLSFDLTFESDGHFMVGNGLKKSLWITLCLITHWLFITRPSLTLICAPMQERKTLGFFKLHNKALLLFYLHTKTCMWTACAVSYSFSA